MLIGDFITDYVCFPMGLWVPGVPKEKLSPNTGLIKPMLDKVFEMIPKEHQLDSLSAGATGPFGLLHVNVYQTINRGDGFKSLSHKNLERLIGPSESVAVKNLMERLLTVYFLWDNCRLYIVPETALLVENTVAKPVITNRDNLIELTRETELQYLTDYIISRVVAKKLEGEY